MTTALSLRDRIAAKRGDIAAGKSKGLRPYKFKVGDTLFRILPDKDPNADWDRRFGQLYLKSFDGADLVVIGDKFLTYGQEDPLREMVFDGMKRAPSEDVKDHFKEMLGGPRVIFNALILNDKEQPAGEPVLVELSETQFDMILAQFMIYLDVDPSHDLASLTRGHVFQCSRTGTGKNDTKYTFLATPKPAPLVLRSLTRRTTSTVGSPRCSKRRSRRLWACSASWASTRPAQVRSQRFSRAAQAARTLH